mgnify:CR=1 FL=1
MNAISKQFTIKNQDITSIDIITMEGLSNSDYKQYLNDEGLFYIDHHEVLRSSGAGLPIATSKEQVKILIKHLERQIPKMR